MAIIKRDRLGRIPAVERIRRICDNCGKMMLLSPWQVNRRLGQNKFCSKKCTYDGRQVTMTFQKGHPDFRPKETRGHRPETRAKIAKVQREKNIRGAEHWNWRGGERAERNRLMGQWEYREWRNAVFLRDNFTCQICGVRGGTLHADHIKRWKDFPELRYEISNGRALCVSCHMKTPTWGKKYRQQIDLEG